MLIIALRVKALALRNWPPFNGRGHTEVVQMLPRNETYLLLINLLFNAEKPVHMGTMGHILICIAHQIIFMVGTQ